MPLLLRGISLGFLLLAASAGQAADPLALPSSTWKLGDLWFFQVEQYARPATDKTYPSTPDTIEARFGLRVLVVGRERLDNRSCCQLNLVIPQNEVPPGQKDHLGLFVERSAGWPRRLLGPPSSAVLSTAGEVAFIRGHPRYFPAEVFPPTDLAAVALDASGRTLAITNQLTPKGSVVEATIVNNGKEELRIRQLWREGEPWWAEYERYVEGRKDLVARRVDAPQKVSSPVPATESAKGLASDPALRVRISGRWANAPLTDILSHLAEKTGRRIELDPKLADRAPALGSMALANVPAWQVMDELATKNVGQGRWESVEGGYRLQGRQEIFATSTPPAGVQWNYWGIAALVLALLGVVLGVLYYRRWCGKRATPRPPTAPETPVS